MMSISACESFLSISIVVGLLIICGVTESARGQSDSDGAASSGSGTDGQQQKQQLQKQQQQQQPQDRKSQLWNRRESRSAISQSMRDQLQRFSSNIDLDKVIADFNAGRNMDRFTPPPVVNPDCHVEVQVTRRLPGRCIKLYNHDKPYTPACQSQTHMIPNDEQCKIFLALEE